MSCTLMYLELSLLIRPERFPLRRVEELVAVDIMQELALQRYIDPKTERDRRLKINGIRGRGHFGGPT